MAEGPMSLRSALTCTWRLFSSTTRPGPCDVEQFPLRDQPLAALHQREQHVEGALAERDRPAFLQQPAGVGLDLETAEAVGRCHGFG